MAILKRREFRAISLSTWLVHRGPQKHARCSSSQSSSCRPRLREMQDDSGMLSGRWIRIEVADAALDNPPGRRSKIIRDYDALEKSSLPRQQNSLFAFRLVLVAARTRGRKRGQWKRGKREWDQETSGAFVRSPTEFQSTYTLPPIPLQWRIYRLRASTHCRFWFNCKKKRNGGP